MQSKTPDSQALARHAVMNVLAGRTADGSAPIDIAVPFPRDNDVMAFAAGNLLAILLDGLPPMVHDDHTCLAAKLLAHAGKAGYTSDAVLWNYPIHTLLEALRAKPDLIRGPAGFATIIKQWNRGRANTLTALAQAPLTRRSLLWSEPPFSLTEVTHPKHLREDGLTLHHCTARMTDWELLGGLERPATEREKLFALTYWRRIDAGRLRILTLMENGVPVVTIEYDIIRRRITHMQAREAISHNAPFLGPLCRALHQFRRDNVLLHIKGLPDTPAPNMVLTQDGTFVPTTADNVRRALAADINVLRHCTPRELLRLAAIPHITLNLTRAPQALRNHLAHAACSIRLYDEQVNLPFLRSVGGDLDCSIAVNVQSPQLRRVGGSNLCSHGKEIHQPRLLTVGIHNDCRRAVRVNQASLRAVGGTNNCRAATALVQHCLASVGSLNLLPPTPEERAARTASSEGMRRRLRGEILAPERL